MYPLATKDMGKDLFKLTGPARVYLGRGYSHTSEETRAEWIKKRRVGGYVLKMTED